MKFNINIDEALDDITGIYINRLLMACMVTTDRAITFADVTRAENREAFNFARNHLVNSEAFIGEMVRLLNLITNSSDQALSFFAALAVMIANADGVECNGEHVRRSVRGACQFFEEGPKPDFGNTRRKATFIVDVFDFDRDKMDDKTAYTILAKLFNFPGGEKFVFETSFVGMLYALWKFSDDVTNVVFEGKEADQFISLLAVDEYLDDYIE